MKKPYTVIFYIDGDRAMETFVERVRAYNASEAFEAAVEQAKGSGLSSSGYPIPDWEWENATEIITFKGYPDAAAD